MSKDDAPPRAQPEERPPAGPGPAPGPAGPVTADDPEVADMEARLAEVQRQLAETPAQVVVANHCIGLFQLAALHLSHQPPKLEDAQLAIDALGAVVEGLRGRLGDDEQSLDDALAQIRLAYVQVKAGLTPGE